MQKQSKFALTICALLLSSCTLTGKSQAANTLGGTLSGKIVDWPADLKGGEVRLMPWYGDYTAAKAPVDAQGNFTLTLDDLKKTPDKLVKNSELLSKKTIVGDVCEGQGTATPDTGLFQEFVIVVWADGEEYGDLSLDNSTSMVIKKGDAEAGLFYFSEPTTLNGTVNCETPYDNQHFKGQYPAGWSLARGELTTTPAGATIYHYDPTAPLTGLSWRMFKETGRMGLSVDYATGRIKAVTAGLPSEKAGLKAGDVIVSFNGKPLLESGGLRGEPDSKVVIVVKRDGQEMTFEVTRVFTRWP